MDVRARMHAGLARQLGHPAGLAGRLVGLMMNRRNRRTITAAVDALAPPQGAVVADIGFGGGVGVELLLDRVASAGRVHAVEVSSAMLSRAARRFRDEIANGRVELHFASLTDLALRPAALDGAITINTIYFIADQDRAFSELARVLQSSGCAVIGLADPEWMRGLPTTAHGFRVRPVSEVTDAATRAGLHVDDRRVGPDPHPYHLQSQPAGVAPADRELAVGLAVDAAFDPNAAGAGRSHRDPPCLGSRPSPRAAPPAMKLTKLTQS